MNNAKSQVIQYYSKIIFTVIIMLPINIFAECVEYTIVDHGHSVEASCIKWSSATESSQTSSNHLTSRITSGNTSTIHLKKGVIFSHNTHASFNCEKCHAYGQAPGKISQFGKDLAHGEACKACHVEMKRGPTGCKDCHKGGSSDQATSNRSSSYSSSNQSNRLSNYDSINKNIKNDIKADNVKSDEDYTDKLDKLIKKKPQDTNNEFKSTYSNEIKIDPILQKRSKDLNRTIILKK